ncbi:Putative cytochrome P450 [Septoria linicola]|uniref:Cytochrome P450 n=1 Tax=Septoria linicola TaxID=215465 RepID=A0A9Q9EG67_9PEZI|nr:putative cytochrome P450 [Septoria linicola]USW48614.1 Putative cytochrome P450 [Septoria linicola]
MATMVETGVLKPVSLIGTFVILSIAYFLGKIVYILANDPLKHVPGPKINAISRIPYIRHLLRGTTVDNVVTLHRKYGSVVRISPNELSFTSGDTAWQDIYGFRTGKMKGHLNTQKDPFWYPPPVNGTPSILLDNDEGHSKGRRLLSHAFSDKALHEQELLIQKYVDQLVDRLVEVSSTDSSPVDMTKFFNWTTFDVIADLLFGEPFGCLQDLSTHKYIKLLFDSVKASGLMYIVGYFPFVKYLGKLVVNKDMLVKRKEFMQWISSQVAKRLERETDRPDFMSHILTHNGEKGLEMSKAQLDSNAFLILTAGSETTATLLSGATFLLLKNPDKLEKLKQEVRGRWKEYSDITLAEVNSAPYLIATLNECLRYFPPVPTGFERRIPTGGEIISGIFVPEGTAVQVSQYPTHHSEANFKDAEKFVPERWLENDPLSAEYVNDKKSAMQPFSFGPRNCIGKNLAHAEMRLIMAKLIWSFDMELDSKSEDWLERCRVFTLWDKPELAVRLTPVRRA